MSSLVQPVIMRQGWQSLLFVHWSVEPELIQARLPPGLRTDTWQGRAYLGVVPFRMAYVHVAGLPRVGKIGRFLELNLRTYVVDEAGVPGVWFFTLDANDTLAVAIARLAFHLPYHRATQTLTQQSDGTLTFRSRRTFGPERGETHLQWRPGIAGPAAAAGTLTHFLIERYVLYTRSGQRLRRGRIAHSPYAPRHAEAVVSEAAALFRAHGFTPPSSPPEHVVCCDGTEVAISALTRV